MADGEESWPRTDFLAKTVAVPYKIGNRYEKTSITDFLTKLRAIGLEKYKFIIYYFAT